MIGTHPTWPTAQDYPVQVDLEWHEHIMERVYAEDYEQAWRIFWPRGYTEPGDQNLIEGLNKYSQGLPTAVVRNFFIMRNSDPEADLMPLLPILRVPTLVLHGENDGSVPLEAGHYLANQIPEAQFYVFKGRCHIPIRTAPVEFANVVLDFVQNDRIK